MFHPRGGTVRRVMEDYSRRRHEEAGYEFVNSPHITKAQLFQVSGHLDWYADAMFPPMHLDEELAVEDAVSSITGWVARRENRSPSAAELPIGES